MTIRNLDALFKPNAIALIGASNQPNSVGAVLARNLFETGFPGPVVTVNPYERAIRSTVNYRSVADLPLTPDLAVVATPPPTVPGIIAELGARGCRAAVVVTAGFGEGGRAEGQSLLQEMLDAARPHLLRIVGPNCLGFISPGQKINASFAHITPPAGDIAFVTQSGALATAVLDWASSRGFGFSHVISVGGMADVDFGDLLDYLALDSATRAILLYVESITAARKFMSAGRIAARVKPVIVIKSGRSSAGARAAMSHTGALAGSDVVYDAAFRRAGMLRVHELRELFAAVTTLSSGIVIGGDRLAILTNGGGAGVLVADALEEAGGRLAMLSPETVEALDAILPAAWSRGNPVDILGDAPGARYRGAVAALLAEPARDAILVMNCPTAVADSLDAAQAVADTVKDHGKSPVLTCWLGEPAAAASRQLFADRRIPTYETPSEAVGAFMHLVEYRRNQDLLMETPPADDILARSDRAAARAVIEAALGEGRNLLSEPEAKAVLEAYGVPTVATRKAFDPVAAAAVAGSMRMPVVLKILSEDIAHKSDVGGVRLDLDSREAVENAAREMLEVVHRRAPGARIAGFVVEEMITRPRALELLLGISVDRVFGPVLLVGHGGTAAEVIGDRAIGLPPLNLVLAHEMIDRTRVARLLRGYRDRPAADLDAVAATLVTLSRLAADFREIAELDINPLIVDDTGVLALDARIVVRAAPAIDDFAIRAYPAELEHEIALRSGATVLIRAIRPDDEPKIVDMVARSTEEDVRLRFLGPLKRLPHQMASRLSQIDYDREIALVAEAPAGGDIRGVARLIADPDNEAAEFAVMVRSDMKGKGIGYELMNELLAHARRRGLKTLFGDVLRENTMMLQMAGELGFTRAATDDPRIVRVTNDLAGAGRAG
jgi:acetyltransferase